MQVVVNGLLAHYDEAGAKSAPTVVILHGWGTSSQNFNALAATLATNYRVIRVDLPGFGGTQIPETAWHVADYAQFVGQFLAKLEVKTFAVIGHSFGGRVAIKGLSQQLFSAQKLILLDSAGLKHSMSPRNQAYKVVAKVGKHVLAAPGLKSLAPGLRRRLYQSAGSTDYLDAGAMRQIFVNTINEDLSPDAARVGVPTLIIWGADDTETPPSDGRKLAALITGSKFSLIPAAGHFVHLDAPLEVATQIEDFLR